MNSLRTPAARTIRTIGAFLLIALLLLGTGFFVWANSVMQGTRPQALEVWTDAGVSITATEHSIVVAPTAAASGEGLVFIPGARVDPYAYLYKLAGVVEQTGLTVVITEPILNLAFFDLRPLETFTAERYEIDTWFVGGHSLGGVRACQYAADPGVAGLVLFGSYCANDLSGTDLNVLSVSASNDGLSTPDKIAAAKILLPADATFVEIEGSNHAQFGDYGVQPGDGESTLSTREVRAELTSILVDFFGANS